MYEFQKPMLQLVRCPRCKYTWYTRSRLGYITCPNCHNKFNRFKHLVVEETEKSIEV